MCAGHGSQGVLTGGGSGRLIAQILTGDGAMSTRRRSAPADEFAAGAGLP